MQALYPSISTYPADWTVFVHRDLNNPGGWRATRFDADGPVGHMEAASYEEALRMAQDSGADLTADPITTEKHEVRRMARLAARWRKTASWFQLRRFFPVSNPLFHATTGPRASSIMQEGLRVADSIRSSGQQVGVSTTRNLDSLLTGNFGNFIFVIDGDRVQSDPVQYSGMPDEFEERVWSGRVPPEAIVGMIQNRPIYRYEFPELLTWGKPVVFKSREAGWQKVAAAARPPLGYFMRPHGYRVEERYLKECRECDGKGTIDGVTCFGCEGFGNTVEVRDAAPPEDALECGSCGGKGWEDYSPSGESADIYNWHPCGECDGWGWSPAEGYRPKFVQEQVKPLFPETKPKRRKRRTAAVSPDAVMQAVRSSLTSDLLKPVYRRRVEDEGANPYTGHCYVAVEALYHLLGGSAKGYKPMFVRHENEPHWFLQGPGGVLDPTAEQFSTPVPYDQGRGKGFLTLEPSARARTVMERAKAQLGGGRRKRADGDVWYHGSPKAFDKFETQFGSLVSREAADKPLFFTRSEEFARMHAGGTGYVYKVRLNVSKTFYGPDMYTESRYWPPPEDTLTEAGRKLFDDLENNRIFAGLIGKDFSGWHEAFGDSQGTFASILSNHWGTLEAVEMLRWFKRQGYDSFYVTGDWPGDKACIAVLDASAVTPLEQVKAANCKHASSYVVDEKRKALMLMRDASNDGYYAEVPVSAILVEPPWHPKRLERALEAIEQGIPIPPVNLYEPPSGRLQISDGIHRTNAAIQSGLSTVPAIVYRDLTQTYTQPPRFKTAASDRARAVARSLLLDAPDTSLDELIEMVRQSSGPLFDADTRSMVPAADVLEVLESMRPEPMAGGVVVYHATTPEAARELLHRGLLPEAKPYRTVNEYAPGRGLSEGLYVGLTPEAVSSYGRVVLEVQVPESQLAVPPELAQLGVTDPIEALQQHDGAVVVGRLPAMSFRKAAKAQRTRYGASMTRRRSPQLKLARLEGEGMLRFRTGGELFSYCDQCVNLAVTPISKVKGCTEGDDAMVLDYSERLYQGETEEGVEKCPKFSAQGVPDGALAPRREAVRRRAVMVKELPPENTSKPEELDQLYLMLDNAGVGSARSDREAFDIATRVLASWEGGLLSQYVTDDFVRDTIAQYKAERGSHAGQVR